MSPEETTGPTATAKAESELDWSDIDREGNIVTSVAAPSSESVPEHAQTPASEPAPEPTKTEPVPVTAPAQPVATPTVPVQEPTPAPAAASDNDDPEIEIETKSGKYKVRKSAVADSYDDWRNSRDYRKTAEEQIRNAKKLAQQAEALVAESDAVRTERDTLKAQLLERTAQDELVKLDPGDEPDEPDRDNFDSTDEGDAEYKAQKAKWQTDLKAWKAKDRAYQAETIRRQVAPPAPPSNPVATTNVEDYRQAINRLGSAWHQRNAAVPAEVRDAVTSELIPDIEAAFTAGVPTPISAVERVLDLLLRARIAEQEAATLRQTKALTADAVARGEANARAAMERGQESPAMLPGTVSAITQGRPDTDDAWTKLLMDDPDNEKLAVEHAEWYAKAIRIKDDKERVRVLGVAA